MCASLSTSPLCYLNDGFCSVLVARKVSHLCPRAEELYLEEMYQKLPGRCYFTTDMWKHLRHYKQARDVKEEDER
jgi:hypothetical protein